MGDFHPNGFAQWVHSSSKEEIVNLLISSVHPRWTMASLVDCFQANDQAYGPRAIVKWGKQNAEVVLKVISYDEPVLPALAQTQAVWGQCGGITYTGPKSCVSGTTCVFMNDWYSQCQPGARPSISFNPTTSTTSSITSVPDTPTSSKSTTSPPGVSTTCSALTANPTSASIPKLPDPFARVAGSRVTTKSDWTCRREEISQLMQLDELGTKPPRPSSVTGSLSGNSMTINVSNSGKAISFSVSISYPSSGTAPYPAIIAYGGMSIPTPAGVAVITFNNDDIAAQQGGTSRGKGKFYTLYGNNHSAGALMAWAWGVSRIIDALETTPNSRINVQQIGVTGCSRNGKGAIVAGAFDERIALTIPQESGSGGAACWRLSDAQKSSGANVQTSSQIVGENVWFSTAFNSFSTSATRLPFDHHLLSGLVATRGLFVIENTSQEWLGNMSCYGCQKAGRTVYEALGVPNNMGFSQVGNHNHCQFPSSQQSELNAFVGKFLLGQSTNTNVFRTDGSFNYDTKNWQPWSVPTLL